MKIYENVLVFNKTKEFSNKWVVNAFNRLRLFLLIDMSVPPPKVIFTSNKNVINKYYQGNGMGCLGFYDETTHTIIFNAEYYNTTSKNFNYKNAEFLKTADINGYKYNVPMSDIYHEILHHIQYSLGLYKHTPLLEGSADIFTQILTGQDNITYNLESTAMWYVGRKILKYNLYDFYNFIINIINNEDLTLLDQFVKNKNITKKLVKNYNGNWNTLFNNIHKEYGHLDYVPPMKKDLETLHKLIYYKY